MSVNARAGFWANPDKWPPFDPPGYLFLGRLVDALGEARHGKDWRPLDPFLSKSPSELLVRKQRATNADAALEALLVKHEARESAFLEIVREIAAAVVDGRLRFALRWTGGTLTPAGNPLWWNSDEWVKHFAKCEMAWQMPHAGRGLYSIFIDSDDALALMQGRGPGSYPAWWPHHGEPMYAWANRAEVAAEAIRRRKLTDPLKPSEKAICRTMEVMFAEAGQITTASSVEQARRER